jgi:hypothetical protein
MSASPLGKFTCGYYKNVSRRGMTLQRQQDDNLMQGYYQRRYTHVRRG